MKAIIINTKGGVSKSTIAIQIVATYILRKYTKSYLFEFDDENLDSENFTESQIISKRVEVGNGDYLSKTVTKLLAKKSDNLVFDIGGNKTTTLFIDALKKSNMSMAVDLFIIPIGSGSQDVVNAFKTYKLINDLGINIIFALSRSRHEIGHPRIKYQYRDFFNTFPNHKYFILEDSDAIDLSRELKKTIYEITIDTDVQDDLFKIRNDAYLDGNDKLVVEVQDTLDIFFESLKFYDTCILPAYNLIENYDTKE